MDKLLDDAEFYLERYSCDCMDSRHIVDISIEFNPEHKENTLLVDFAEKHDGGAYTLWERITRAYLFVRGKELWGHGFLIRQADIPSMIELLGKARLEGEKE